MRYRAGAQDRSVIEQDRRSAHLGDRTEAVAYEEDRVPAPHEALHLALALFLEGDVADRKHLVDDEDLRLQVRCDRKRQARVHAARIALDRCIDEFSEIREFIDTPVKRYSSGMHSRLAFSVAAHLEPEILIVDEVLSVGDIAFQKKCQRKMQSFMRSGHTVLFVSHSLGSISEMCTSAILLDHGTILRAGAVPHVIEAYLSMLNASSGDSEDPSGPLVHADCEILGANVLTESGKPSRTFDISDPVVLEFRYRVKRDLFSLHIELTVSRNMVDLIRSYDTDGYKDPNRHTPAGDYVCRHVIPGRFLKGGSYSVKIGAGTPDYSMIEADNILAFEVEELSENTRHRGYMATRPGQVISPGKWTTEKATGIPEQQVAGEAR